ncbi:MAG: hypothetical protein KJZ78_06570, partial [Bryobacteraceae bacterium]|nr:hypothetical protein [Bryobacteraceae bacterium]
NGWWIPSCRQSSKQAATHAVSKRSRSWSTYRND